jgi:hypothetical protein
MVRSADGEIALDRDAYDQVDGATQRDPDQWNKKLTNNRMIDRFNDDKKIALETEFLAWL